MRYLELIAALQEKYQLLAELTSNNSPAIKDIRLLDSNEHHWKEHVVYVGNFAQLKTPPDLPIMLLSGDKPLSLPEGSNYTHIRNEDLYNVFNTAKDLIFEDLRADGLFFTLAQMALRGKSIGCVIDTAAKLLGNALILVDSSQKVLAHSTTYEIVDPLWAQNVERGYCSYDFVQMVRSNKQMKEWSKQGSETQVITLPGDLQPKLVTRITQESHVVGALVMIEHHTSTRRSYLRLLPLVGRLLFDVFNRDTTFEGAYGSFYSTLLCSLLNEEEITNTLEQIAMLKVDFPEKMSVVVARFVSRLENRYLKHTFSMELERIFPDGHSFQHKSYIGILVPSISEEQTQGLTELAQYEDVSIGVSWTFLNITEFKRHFNQAVASIKQAQRFGRANQVFDYSDFQYFDLLYNYTGKTPLEHYCHPALAVLREYDKQNNTELYITLRTYLEHKNNLRSTAEALFVHRNTLIYRISRINQLISLDLNNINVVYSLADSFRIETFLNQ